MSKFIEVTADNQTKIIINTALIGSVFIERDSGCTVIIDTQGETLKVEETYDEVKAMLNVLSPRIKDRKEKREL